MKMKIMEKILKEVIQRNQHLLLEDISVMIEKCHLSRCLEVSKIDYLHDILNFQRPHLENSSRSWHV